MRKTKYTVHLPIKGTMIVSPQIVAESPEEAQKIALRKYYDGDFFDITGDWEDEINTEKDIQVVWEESVVHIWTEDKEKE